MKRLLCTIFMFASGITLSHAKCPGITSGNDRTFACANNLAHGDMLYTSDQAKERVCTGAGEIEKGQKSSESQESYPTSEVRVQYNEVQCKYNFTKPWLEFYKKKHATFTIDVDIDEPIPKAFQCHKVKAGSPYDRPPYLDSDSFTYLERRKRLVVDHYHIWMLWELVTDPPFDHEEKRWGY